MKKLWRIARLTALMAALGLSWWSCTRSGPQKSAGELIPGVGLGSVRLGMTGEQVRAIWGDPDIRVESIWDYPSRCAVVTFDSQGAAQFVGIGNSAYPKKAFASCRGEGIEGGPRIGDTIEVARAKYRGYDGYLERPFKTGGSLILVPSLRLHLEMTSDGVLHFAATQAERSPTREAGGPAGKLVPGSGIDGVHLGSTAEQVKEAWGKPDIQVGTIWDYSSRCAVVTFDAETKVHMIGIGNSADPEKAFASCRGMEVEDGPRIGDSIEQVRAMYRDRGELVERPFKTGGQSIYVKTIGLHLEFKAAGAFHFAAIQANLPTPTPSPDPGDSSPR